MNAACRQSTRERALRFLACALWVGIVSIQPGFLFPAAEPAPPAAALDQARQLLQTGRYTEALALLRRLEQEPAPPSAVYLLLALAERLRPGGGAESALPWLEKARERAPDDAEVHLYLALLHQEMHHPDEAAVEFDRAIALAGNASVLLAAHLGALALHLARGEQAEADTHLRAARTIHPGIDEWLKQAEIARLTPRERIFPPEDGLHPSLEERVRRLRGAWRRIREKKKER